MTCYLRSIVMFALSITIYEIFANKIKFPNFDLKNEGQGEEGEKNGSSLAQIRLEMFKSTLKIFSEF